MARCEGAGGIGGLLARSHEFTECSTNLTYCITNNSGFCISNLMVWDDYQVYVSDVYIGEGETWCFTVPGVPGREYRVGGDSCDEYYIQVYIDQFTGTLENHNVHFVGEGDWNCSEGANCVTETGNPLCLPGLSGGQWLTHNYYHADGNGNITALASSAQTLTASYRYDPFGNIVSQSGGLANANKYRFSSKLIHATSGLYYYGYRFYSPNLQRWVNRDPIEEEGGINLFAFVLNDSINRVDLVGLDCWIVKSTGGWEHEYFVGQNPDGSYWVTDLMPGKGGLRLPDWASGSPLHCKANDTTPSLWTHGDPNKLKDLKQDKAIELQVKEHIKCSKDTDAKIKQYVNEKIDKNPTWNAGFNNCKDYTAKLAKKVKKLNKAEDKTKKEEEKKKEKEKSQ